MAIGNQIALFRKEKGMTQEALANVLGVSNQAVSKWESEQCCPDIQLLPGLADVFGVSIDRLFGREEAKKEDTLTENQTEQEELQSVKTKDSISGLPWEDDNTLRVVLFLGHKLESHQNTDRLNKITFTYEGEALNVQSCFSVHCDTVQGDVSAGGYVECEDIGGNVSAGGYVECRNVGANVSAGGYVECGDTEGNVSAGGYVECGDVGGNASSGGYVECGDVEGDVSAGDYVSCGDVAGDVSAQKGNVECGDVEGDVTAGGDVSCGDVGGDVNGKNVEWE